MPKLNSPFLFSGPDERLPGFLSFISMASSSSEELLTLEDCPGEKSADRGLLKSWLKAGALGALSESELSLSSG